MPLEITACNLHEGYGYSDCTQNSNQLICFWRGKESCAKGIQGSNSLHVISASSWYSISWLSLDTLEKGWKRMKKEGQFLAAVEHSNIASGSSCALPFQQTVPVSLTKRGFNTCSMRVPATLPHLQLESLLLFRPVTVGNSEKILLGANNLDRKIPILLLWGLNPPTLFSLWYRTYYIITLWIPLVINHVNWKATINGGFNGKIIYKWAILHCHVWLPEGNTFFLASHMISSQDMDPVECWSPDLWLQTMVSSHEYKWDKPQELGVTWTKHHWHQFVRQIIRNHESHRIYKGPKQSIGSLLWYADQTYPKTSMSLSNSFTKDTGTRWALGFVSTWSGAMAAQSRTQNEEIQSQTSFSRLLILTDLATPGIM